MGNEEAKSVYNDNISFLLKLEKICYFPGENIKGTIYLRGRQGLKETLLKTPKSIIIIYQEQYFSDPEYSKKKRDKIYEKHLNFVTFQGANLLNKVSIPFSIKLPKSAIPSYSIKNSHYINHFISVEFPLLGIRRVLFIVIKNNPYFTKENKLYREPCKKMDAKSKSDFLTKKGNYKMTIILPKNVFYYDEVIPYEINIDCQKLDLILDKLEVSLQRIIKTSNKSSIVRKDDKDLFLLKSIKLNNKIKIHKLKGKITFPNKNYEDKLVYLPSIYDLIEKNGPYNADLKDFHKKYYFAPCSRGELIIIEYKLKIKIYFINVLTLDDSKYIDIDFCSRPEVKKANEIKGSISNAYSQIFSNMVEKPKEIDLSQNKTNNIEVVKNKEVDNTGIEQNEKKDNLEMLPAPPLPALNENDLNKDINKIINNDIK